MAGKNVNRLYIYILIQTPSRLEIRFPDKTTAESYREKIKSKGDGLSPPPTSEDPIVAFDLPDSVEYITWSESDQQFIVRFREGEHVANWVDDTICVRIDGSEHRVGIKQYLPAQESNRAQVKTPVENGEGKLEKRGGTNRKTRHPGENSGPGGQFRVLARDIVMAPSATGRCEFHIFEPLSSQKRGWNDRENGDLGGGARGSAPTARGESRSPPSQKGDCNDRGNGDFNGNAGLPTTKTASSVSRKSPSRMSVMLGRLLKGTIRNNDRM